MVLPIRVKQLVTKRVNHTITLIRFHNYKDNKELHSFFFIKTTFPKATLSITILL